MNLCTSARFGLDLILMARTCHVVIGTCATRACLAKRLTELAVCQFAWPCNHRGSWLVDILAPPIWIGADVFASQLAHLTSRNQLACAFQIGPPFQMRAKFAQALVRHVLCPKLTEKSKSISVYMSAEFKFEFGLAIAVCAALARQSAWSQLRGPSRTILGTRRV